MGIKTVTETAREVPVIAEVDVLVIGSGPGGLAAAHRRGARRREHHGGRTLRLPGRQHHGRRRGEPRLVPPRKDDRLRRDRHRVRAARQGDGRDQPRGAVEERSDQRRHVQVRRRQAGRRSRGSRRCCTRWRSTPSWRAPTSRGVIVHSKSGRGAILARRVIDASGDADIAALFGRALSQDAQGKDVAGDGDVFGHRRRAQALPRLRRRQSDQIQGLGPRSGTRRRAARRTSCSAPTWRSRSRAPAPRG